MRNIEQDFTLYRPVGIYSNILTFLLLLVPCTALQNCRDDVIYDKWRSVVFSFIDLWRGRNRTLVATAIDKIDYMLISFFLKPVYRIDELRIQLNNSSAYIWLSLVDCSSKTSNFG